jgi:hypothetical protein
MSTSHLIGHVRVLWRAERLMAELRLKRLLGTFALQALAALIAACALLLFELASYLALVPIWGAIWSAAVLGAFNLAIAGLVALLALRRPASHELMIADEVHQQAFTAFQTELQRAEEGSPASLLAALESAAVPLLLPIIPLVIRRLRKHAPRQGPKEAA